MTTRRLTLALVFLTGLAATASAVAAASGLGDKPKGSMPDKPRDLAGVNFVNGCGFSHRAPDDPIVFPGQPGASHDHSFVGNRTTNAFSTLESLLGAASSCDRPGHTAAYWLPTLVVNGNPVAPLGSTIYYRRRTVHPVRAFPAGFRMIAGDARATTPQGLRVTFWNCGVEAGLPPSSTPPACPSGRRTTLRLHVTFPNCWDGKSLDSADHKSHMTYAMRGVCPTTHRYEVPSISIIYRYPEIASGSTVTLASGGQYSAHADFFNSWDSSTLHRLVAHCLNALRHCGRGE